MRGGKDEDPRGGMRIRLFSPNFLNKPPFMRKFFAKTMGNLASCSETEKWRCVVQIKKHGKYYRKQTV
jgi:hypothetical protein